MQKIERYIMALDRNYEIKKGDTLWGVAKKQLQVSGSKKPTNAQIVAAMKQIAETNGCKDIDECANKFFNKVGNKLDVTGFSNRVADETFVDFNDGAVLGKPKAEKPAQPSLPDTVTPAETKLPELTEAQLKELKDKLGKEFPQLSDIDKEKFKKRYFEVNRLNNPFKLTFDEVKRHNPNMSLDEVLYAVYDILKDDYKKTFDEIRKEIIEANNIDEIEYYTKDVDPRLKEYIKERIFPEYDKNDKGHGIVHIKEVIRRSFALNDTFKLGLKI